MDLLHASGILRPQESITMSQLLRDLKEAIAGSEQDFTQGHLGRAIFLLAVPWFWKWLWNRSLPWWISILCHAWVPTPWPLWGSPNP